VPETESRIRSIFRSADGQWRSPSPSDPWGPGIPLPGARDMTIKERVGRRARQARRYGDWIEIDKDAASIHSDVLIWCRKHCNSEMPSGTFRIAPKVWGKHGDDPINYPYVPELDDPSETIRDLASAEWLRRCAAADLQRARGRRHDLIQLAGKEGHSRRRLARLLGLSFGRIQQLTRMPPTTEASQAPGSGSDGTRTRDLRRDRPAL
jgi:hypothetical protein